MKKIVDKRYDFLLLFDVRDGNPNGDPDAGNMPRLDPETMHGLVTDGCLKRKVRDFVSLAVRADPARAEGNEIYVQHHNRGGIALNAQHLKAYKELGIKPVEGDDEEEAPNEETGEKKAPGKKKETRRDDIEKARKWMCANFFDIRTFGAVMSTGVNCGQVRGPVQITFARSVDPILAAEAAITRVAFTTEEKTATSKGMSEMGRKNFVPYALYVARGFVSPMLAADTGFTYADLDLFFRALCEMFDHDRSAARGLMATRRLYVFQHASVLGEAPAHRLLERIERAIRRRDGVAAPRSFDDYVVPSVEEIAKGLLTGVTVREVTDGGYAPTPW